MQSTHVQQLQGEQIVVINRYLYIHECEGVEIYDVRQKTKIKVLRIIFGCKRGEVAIDR